MIGWIVTDFKFIRYFIALASGRYLLTFSPYFSLILVSQGRLKSNIVHVLFDLLMYMRSGLFAAIILLSLIHI